jgi:hypothetical protein
LRGEEGAVFFIVVPVDASLSFPLHGRRPSLYRHGPLGGGIVYVRIPHGGSVSLASDAHGVAYL